MKSTASPNPKLSPPKAKHQKDDEVAVEMETEGEVAPATKAKFVPADDLRCRMCIRCKCMERVCRCFNVIPFTSVATLVAMIVILAKISEYYSDLKTNLLTLFVVSPEIEGILEFGGIIMLISAFLNGFVCLQSFIASDYFMMRCCRAEERREGLKRICKCIVDYITWSSLALAFCMSYIATLFALLLTMVAALLPILAGLCFGTCSPIYNGSLTLTNTTLHDVMVIIQAAKDEALHDSIGMLLQDVKLDTISDAQTLEYCEMFEGAVGTSGWLFSCCVALVVLQVNFVIISRGNLVKFGMMQKQEEEIQKEMRSADTSAKSSARSTPEKAAAKPEEVKLLKKGQ